MPAHEGLTGLVAEEVMPVAVDDVTKHSRYKYFKDSGEEGYHSFLGVPLIHRGILQGVLVVQTREARMFRESEIKTLAEGGGGGRRGWRRWGARRGRWTGLLVRRRSGCGRWPGTSGGAGTTTASVCFAI